MQYLAAYFRCPFSSLSSKGFSRWTNFANHATYHVTFSTSILASPGLHRCRIRAALCAWPPSRPLLPPVHQEQVPRDWGPIHGQPFIEYLPCCDPGAAGCLEEPAKGRGRFCELPTTATTSAPKPSPAARTTAVPPRTVSPKTATAGLDSQELTQCPNAFVRALSHDFIMRMADRDRKTWEVEVPTTLPMPKVSATFGLFWTLAATDDQLIVKYEGNTLATFTGPGASYFPLFFSGSSTGPGTTRQ